jgi:hypothetical protein
MRYFHASIGHTEKNDTFNPRQECSFKRGIVGKSNNCFFQNDSSKTVSEEEYGLCRAPK